MRTFVCAFALGLSAAPRAAAQDVQRPQDTPHPFGRLRFGALSVTPMVAIGDIGFDTNVFDLTGTEQLPADFTTTIQPSVEVRWLTNRLDVRFTEHADLVYYQRYADQRSINPRNEILANYRLSSTMSLYGTGELGYSRLRTSVEIDVRERRLSHAALLGARLRSRKFEADIHGGYTDLAYDAQARYQGADLAQTLNHTSQIGGGSVGYRLTPFTTFNVSGELALHHFGLSPERDSTTIDGGVGLQFNPRAIVNGSVGIGYHTVDPKSPTVPRVASWAPQAGISYTLRDLVTVGIGAEQRIENSFFTDRPYFVGTIYEGSIRQALFHRFDIGASVQYWTVGYQRFVTLGAPPPELPPTEHLRIAAASLGFPIARQMRLAWYVQQTNRLSVDRPYQEIRSGLEMTVGRAQLSPRGVFLHGPGR
jgi:opacity protein-like surface antigen